MKGHPIGTRVVIVRVNPALRNGRGTMLGAFAAIKSNVELYREKTTGELYYGQAIDVDGYPGDFASPPSWLEPVRNDGHEKSSWDEAPEWLRRVVEETA